MIDIHSHIVFGLDDGAKTIEESVEIAKKAYQTGTRVMVATPHFRELYSYEETKYEENFLRLRERLSDEKIDLKLFVGNEAYLDENLLECLINGKCKTMAGSSYVLIEISYGASMHMVKNMLFAIMLQGYKPIIAHAERLVERRKDMNFVKELNAMGCLLQMNGGALFGLGRPWKKHWLWKSLRENMVNFIASDTHDLLRRGPELKRAYKRVKKRLGKETADNLFIRNQLSMIKNEKMSWQSEQSE